MNIIKCLCILCLILKNLVNKLKESFFAVFPITIIVLVLSFALTNIDHSALLLFAVSAGIIIVGMSLFTLGVDISMLPMGESIGASIAENKKVWLMLIVAFVLGFLITIAEPDLQVLAGQLSSIPTSLLILTISVGVGFLLVLYYVKLHFNVKLSVILIIAYTAVFVLAIFVPPNFMPLAFDSGGVTTGPIVVPFLMAVGIGLSTVKGSSKNNDSFGIIALCTIGPIIMVMLLGLIYNPQTISTDTPIDTTYSMMQFLYKAPHYLKEVAIAYAPIILVFIIAQLTVLKFHKKRVIRIAIGLVYTYVGLCLFLLAVNVGFLPVGKLLGQELAKLSYNWVLIPFGFIIGFVIILAEPTIHILIKQVEELTGGAVSRKIMLICLTLGVAVIVAVSMLRILYSISLWYFLAPGYFIALLLTFFVPSIFTSVAFDSGSVSSGPMTVTFILPFALGACSAVGGNLMLDAFGIVAMVSMAPLLTIQIFGLIYKIKLSKKAKIASQGELVAESTLSLDTDNISEDIKSEELYQVKDINTQQAEYTELQEDEPIDLNSEEPIDLNSDEPIDLNNSDEPIDLNSDEPIDLNNSEEPIDLNYEPKDTQRE